MVRISRDQDLPLHFEAVALRARLKVVGWPVGLVAIVAGVTLVGRVGSPLAEAVGVVLAMVGGTLVVALIRCRRFEVTVGRKLVELRLGPFRRTLPAGGIQAARVRPATSWRRLFADREAVLRLGIDSRPVIVPTEESEELCEALLGEE